jgi:hypothetical protein
MCQYQGITIIVRVILYNLVDFFLIKTLKKSVLIILDIEFLT